MKNVLVDNRHSRVALSFLLSTGIVWATVALGETPLSASTPPVTGSLDVSQSAAVVVRETTNPLAPVTVSTFNLQVTNYYADLDLTAIVSVTASDPGVLALDSSGLTLTTTTSSDSLEFTGSAADVVTALDSRITWTSPQSPGTVQLTVDVTQELPANTIVDPASGHLYFVDPLVKHNQSGAATFLTGKNLWGRDGHLAAITSQAENEFLYGALSTGRWWIGGSDTATEGNWTWASVPEIPASNLLFWDDSVQSTGQRGIHPLSGRFAWWQDGEPNNTKECDNVIFNCRYEDYAVFNATTGRWNDDDYQETLPIVVEYSSSGGTDAPHHDLLSVNITVQSRFVHLVDYANTNAPSLSFPLAPNAAEWIQAGASGVPSEAFASSLNSLLAQASITGSNVDTLVELQAIVDAYQRVVNYASSGGTTIAPSSTIYATLGITGLDSSAARRMNALVRNVGASGVASASQLTTLATEAAIVPPTTTTTTVVTTTTVATTTTSTTVVPTTTTTSTSTPTSTSTTQAVTTTASPTTAPTTDPAPDQPTEPLAGPDGSLDSQTAMTARALVDGRTVPLAVDIVSSNGVRITGSGFAINLNAVDANGEPFALQGSEFVVPKSGRLVTSGSGFVSSSKVDTWVFSDPVFLGSSTVSNTGAFSIDVEVPAALPSGYHTLQFTGTPESGGSQAVSIGIRVTESGAPPFPPNRALDDPVGVVELATAGVAVLAATSGAAAAAGGHSRGGERTEERAELGSIDVVGIGVETDGRAAGDASRLWRWPGTSFVDKVSATWTVGLGPRLPLLSRVIADGSSLRAILGGMSVLFPLAGVILGIWSVIDTSGIAMPPATGLMIAIILLGVFDAFAGLLAFSILAIGVTISGGIIDVDSVRALMGIGVVCFAPGLIASAFRAIRRPPSKDSDELWERLVDFPVVALLAGMTAQTMVSGINGVAGIDFPFGYEANRVALLVIGAMSVKLLIEESATRWFPMRLAVVSPPDVPEPSTPRQSFTVATKTAVYVFVVAAILGNVWQLWVAALMFALPLFLNLAVDRLPNIPWIWRLIPLGVPSLVFYFLVGTYAGLWIESWLGETADYARTSFVAMTVPFAAIGVLMVFGREPDEDEVRWCYRPRWRWVYRVGGTAMLIFAVSQHMGWI